MSVSASEDDFSEALGIMLEVSFLDAASPQAGHYEHISSCLVPRQPILLCSKC